MNESYRTNPFKKIRLIMPEAILDKAIRRSMRLSLPKVKDPLNREKLLLINRIQTIGRILVSDFRNYLRSIPDLKSLHEFYRSVLNIYSNLDDFKKTLGRIAGGIRVLEMLTNRYIRDIRSIKRNPYLPNRVFIRHINKLWRQYLARIHSFIREISSAFHHTNEVIRKLRKLPDYDPELETVVVCGPPNSGKSSLVGKLSKARVQIAEYPFTTKNLVFGHVEICSKPKKILQIVDSPGLFDRPIEKRKKEELLALQAIKTIASGIIFLFDCSIERTLEADQQLRVFDDVLRFMQTKKIVVCINKIDIADKTLHNKIYRGIIHRTKIKPIPLSVKHNIGIDHLLEMLRELFGDADGSFC